METEEEDNLYFIFYKSLYEDVYQFVKNQFDSESKILLKKLKNLIIKKYIILELELFNEIKIYFQKRQDINNAYEIYCELLNI